jgi:hypothetical protein
MLSHQIFTHSGSFGSMDVVRKFFRALFNMRMPQARLPVVWDVPELLRSLESRWPLESLSLLELSCRTATLLAITTAQRVQSLESMTISHSVIREKFCFAWRHRRRPQRQIDSRMWM